MARQIISIHIHQPIEDVFAFVTTPQNRPLWMRELAEVDAPISEIAVGSRWRETALYEEDRCLLENEVTALQANQSLELRTTGSGFESISQYRFTPSENGTQLTYTQETRYRGVLPRLLGWFLARKEHAVLKHNFHTLKQRLEEDEH
jgi:uncharacterized protein YndB with AHSA1/START domain